MQTWKFIISLYPIILAGMSLDYEMKLGCLLESDINCIQTTHRKVSDFSKWKAPSRCDNIVQHN